MSTFPAKDWGWQKHLRFWLAKGLAWFAAMLFFLMAIGFGYFAFYIYTLPPAAQIRDIGGNRRLVEAASLHIREFQTINHRLPTVQEFQRWKDVASDYEGGGAWYSTGPFSDSARNICGSPPDNGYTLSYWDDGVVTYASWFRDGSKVFIEDSEYFYYGSRMADTLFFCAFGIILFILTIYWIRKMTEFELQ